MKKVYTDNILGVNIAISSMPDAINLILEQAHELKGEYVCFSNVHTTVTAHKDADYRAVQNGAFAAFPDGAPLSYVQRFRGHKEATRVAGPDFMDNMWKATENTELSHYFYGSTEETLEKMIENIHRKYPGTKIAGYESPPFRPLTEEEDEAAVGRINDSGAAFVWVGLGAPKQEIWMANHKDSVHALMLGVGAGFDFHAGLARRAPAWMQAHYLEWLYRLLEDPKRLWKRYFTTNGKFIALLLKEMFSTRQNTADARQRVLVFSRDYEQDADHIKKIAATSDVTVICQVPDKDGHVDRYYRTHKYYYENYDDVHLLRLRVPEVRKGVKLSYVYRSFEYYLSAILAYRKVGRVGRVVNLTKGKWGGRLIDKIFKGKV